MIALSHVTSVQCSDWPQRDARCCFDHVCFGVFYCEIFGIDNFGCDANFSMR